MKSSRVRSSYTPGPVAIERRMGFAEEIEFTIEVLPDGIALAPAKSFAPDETAAAVKLSLTATTGPHSARNKIIGRALGDSELTVVALPTPPAYSAP